MMYLWTSLMDLSFTLWRVDPFFCNDSTWLMLSWPQILAAWYSLLKNHLCPIYSPWDSGVSKGVCVTTYLLSPNWAHKGTGSIGQHARNFFILFLIVSSSLNGMKFFMPFTFSLLALIYGFRCSMLAFISLYWCQFFLAWPLPWLCVYPSVRWEYLQGLWSFCCLFLV